MPFRLSDLRAKIQFVTYAAMPSQITAAAKLTGKVSNTQYIQHAVCRQLAKDLGIPLDQLLEQLPPPKGPAAFLSDGTRHVQPSSGRA